MASIRALSRPSSPLDPAASGDVATQASAAPRLAGAITGEVCFDWSRHAAGALPAADDTGVPIYLKKYFTTDTPLLRSNGGIVMMVADMADVVSGNGAIYLNQALPSARQVKRITADFAFGPGTPSSTCIALCAWADVTMPVPEKAPIHVSIGVTGYDISYYDASTTGAITLASGTFSTPLAQDWSPLHAEVEVIGNQLCVTLPDGSYVESTANANVSALPGIVACWEIFQPVGTCRVGVIRGTADGWSRSPLTPTEGRIARMIKKLFPSSILVDPVTGNVGIQAPAVSWATFLTSGVMACNDAYAANAPSQPFYLTRRDYVDAADAAIVAARAPDLVPTAVQTGTSVTALAGQLVLVAPTAFQTVTAPAAVVGARFGVKRTNNYNASANTQISAASGDSWVNTDNPPFVRTRDEVLRFRCDVANQWLLEQAGMTSSGANGYMVLGTDTRLTNARTPTAHAASHAPDGTDPLTAFPRAVSAGASTSIDVAAAGDVDLTCTGDTAITFTGTPVNGRNLVITCLASGAIRTPSVPGTVSTTTGVTARSLAIPSGGRGRFVLRYTTLGTAGWTLDSAYLFT